MDSRALRLVSKHAVSLTTSASKLAPTGGGYCRSLDFWFSWTVTVAVVPALSLSLPA
ncbi:hypothetical protein QF017_005694 [Pseudomonas laurylsulfatiphila]